MNISGIFILFAHWSDFVDRNDKAFTLLYKVVIHKKVSHPYEIQNIIYILSYHIIHNNILNHVFYVSFKFVSFVLSLF